MTEATEKTGSTQNWTQSWNYDRYGNRIGFAQNVAGFTEAPNPAVNQNTNRFSSGQGFTYDLNGNLVVDNEGRQFTFNGDNKQTVVRDASNNVIGQYFYDGEGKRVKKITNSETTVFVYSSGKLIAEYSNQVSQAPTVAYTTTDHLGSPRIITDQYGQVRSRRDFMPFGEDIFQNVGASRTASLGYSISQDDIRQKFTGYQKDSETQLDFAEARMYENRFGRFTAVDPLMSSANIYSPQTWNRYNYCGGNPIACTDPSGMDGLWGMQYRDGRVKLKFFKSQEEMVEENKILDTPFCREMATCVGWEKWDREYFLYENQSASHLSSAGVKTDFSVATIGDENWKRLVDDFYSPTGFSEWGSHLLKTLYEGQLRQDKVDRILGLKENPNHLEMGGNPLRAARDAIRALKYTIGDYGQLQRAARGTGLDAHKVGQKSGMEQFVPGYDFRTAPAILIPREGHRFNIPGVGRIATDTEGFINVRQLVARDIRELRRVFPDIPNSQLQGLINLNRSKYPTAFFKPPREGK